MNIDKFTTKFQEALAEAQALAVTRNHTQVEPEHLLSALLNQENGTTTYLLKNAGVRTPEVREKLDEALNNLARSSDMAANITISHNLNKRF